MSEEIQQKLTVLDLIINVVQEQEKKLSDSIHRLENVSTRLENVLSTFYKKDYLKKIFGDAY